MREYKLIAVIYHVGKNASGGHFLTDVYHFGLNKWIRYDDTNVKLVNSLSKFDNNLTPYLLFYSRKDSF